MSDVIICHILQYDNRFRVHNGKITQRISPNDRRYCILKNNIAYKHQTPDKYDKKLIFVRFNYIKRNKYMSMVVSVYEEYVITELYILYEKHGAPTKYHKTILY